jgi:hypothetical protein
MVVVGRCAEKDCKCKCRTTLNAGIEFLGVCASASALAFMLLRWKSTAGSGENELAFKLFSGDLSPCVIKFLCNCSPHIRAVVVVAVVVAAAVVAEACSWRNQYDFDLD